MQYVEYLFRNLGIPEEESKELDEQLEKILKELDIL